MRADAEQLILRSRKTRLLGRLGKPHRDGMSFRRGQSRYLEPLSEYAADHSMIDHLPVVHGCQLMAEVIARGAKHGRCTACIQANIDCRTARSGPDGNTRDFIACGYGVLPEQDGVPFSCL